MKCSHLAETRVFLGSPLPHWPCLFNFLFWFLISTASQHQNVPGCSACQLLFSKFNRGVIVTTVKTSNTIHYTDLMYNYPSSPLGSYINTPSQHPTLVLQGAWVPSLLGELRSHKPHGAAKKIKKISGKMNYRVSNIGRTLPHHPAPPNKF